MFQRLVSHNDDLRRLVEKGYAVGFDSNCLIVRDIPYLNADGTCQVGALVAKMVFIDEDHVQQQDHQVYFAGGIPHGLDSKPIANLGGGTMTLPLSEACSDVVVQRSFSNKPRPTGKFANFFEKIESYVRIISGPAMEKCTVSPLTFRAVETVVPDSVFKIHDTMTSRAGIGDIAETLSDDVVAIIGLGGTGSYVLDFLVKTPVHEIRAFDSDDFHVHTSFRSPGRLDRSEFGRMKADVYRERYEDFRHGLTLKSERIDSSSKELLTGVTFSFVCVDKGSSRSAVFDLLISMGIPFIDVGMGLKRLSGSLTGQLRTTYVDEQDSADIRKTGLVELADQPDDIYRSNIQISELNALNACLAVLRYKQLRAFYSDDRPFRHIIFGVNDTSIYGLPNHDDDA